MTLLSFSPRDHGFLPLDVCSLSTLLNDVFMRNVQITYCKSYQLESFNIFLEALMLVHIPFPMVHFLLNTDLTVPSPLLQLENYESMPFNEKLVNTEIQREGNRSSFTS